MSTPGLRERKKRRTREAIRSAAFDLFDRMGYAATTVNEIAAAAEVSPATFYRYFPTKEAVVVSDEYDDLFEPAAQAGPPDEPLLEMFRRTFRQVLGRMAEEADLDRLRRRNTLLAREPALRAAMLEVQEEAVGRTVAEMAAYSGRSTDDLRLRVIARVVHSAVTETVGVWLDRGGEESLPELLDETFAMLRDGIEP